jgi:hypothetical protein
MPLNSGWPTGLRAAGVNDNTRVCTNYVVTNAYGKGESSKRKKLRDESIRAEQYPEPVVGWTDTANVKAEF